MENTFVVQSLVPDGLWETARQSGQLYRFSSPLLIVRNNIFKAKPQIKPACQICPLVETEEGQLLSLPQPWCCENRTRVTAAALGAWKPEPGPQGSRFVGHSCPTCPFLQSNEGPWHQEECHKFPHNSGWATKNASGIYKNGSVT